MEKDFYKNKTILVTGGAGSIGSQIVKMLLEKGAKTVRVLDNNETGLFELGHQINSPNLRLFVGDVRDKARLARACQDVDIVFHAAALKHVPLCEYNPFEAVQTNVIGTQNLINAAIACKVAKVVNISTDKAINPQSVMGATKLLTEKLVTAANFQQGKSKTIFASVRFGNVLNSKGSIVPLIRELIKMNRPITITDPEMTRFIMEIRQAVELVLTAAIEAKGGEVFILKMPKVRMGDLIDCAIEKFCQETGKKYPTKKMIGPRPGEKFYEELLTEEEADIVISKPEMFILPARGETKFKAKKGQKAPFEEYHSRYGAVLSREEIKKILSKI